MKERVDGRVESVCAVVDWAVKRTATGRVWMGLFEHSAERSVATVAESEERATGNAAASAYLITIE